MFNLFFYCFEFWSFSKNINKTMSEYTFDIDQIKWST